MAFRTRHQLENALARPVGVSTKLLGQNGQARSALGNIQNKVSVPTGNDQLKKPAPLKARQTRSTTALNKENARPTRTAQTKKDSKVENDKPVVVVPPQPRVVETDANDLSANLMEVSITESFSSSILPEGVTDIDKDDHDNHFLCSEFVMDIYKYLRELEVKWTIRPDFLVQQPDITPRMRAILVDWLNQVHNHFGLLPETFYLTVATIDRFLQKHPVSRKHLQLVGITSMFIASKYEEMYSPAVTDFVYITDSAYSKQDIFKMECLILKTLQFSFGRPLPLHFLRRNSKAGDCDALVHGIAKFMMELSMQDYDLASVSPSLLAASALRLSLLIMDNEPWTPDLTFYSGYTETQMRPVMSQLAKLVLRNGSSKLQAVHKKYSSSKLMKVSTLPQLRSQAMLEASKLD